MFDATEAEFARREHAAEMGAESRSDRAWSRFYDAADKAIRARGWQRSHDAGLDGDDDVDGYSIDAAYEAFEAGASVADYLEIVDRKRLKLTAGKAAL